MPSASMDTVMATTPALLLYGALMVAAVWDLWKRRVPNAIPLALAIVGLVLNLWLRPTIDTLLVSAGGLALAALLWVPPYALRLVGGADVKLAAAVGIWLGPLSTLRASIYAGLAVGVVALIWLMSHRGLLGGWVYLRVLPRAVIGQVPMSLEEGRQTLPFAVAIAVGVALELAGLRLL